MKDWENIGFVHGNGTTNEVSNYDFTDDLNRVGFENRHGLYYRLKQIDLPAGQAGFDGKYEYSNIINLTIQQAGNQTIKVFPNPTADYITVNVEIPTTIHIINNQGQVVLEKQMNSNQQLDIQHLPNGHYFIKVGQNTQKFIIQK